ncbi:hypothetical protein J4G43_015020 [Bradyrhizobium barranii subsp. barranii]|uniref:Uncharacterized protein n=1 Tax=Bradyrhizobium barranii subsp. barranii TaxID=2823807 RepID=A0A939RY68_9BRAD|nr:hypothetical protein [Bradyrhizobium barranii]UEM17884.1 hypothetical protein J4G43_015020 [Bradyrhizobium barranii subsp. barranii]
MNRTGDPSVEVLLARIAALQAENHQLADRVVKLEEELALARLRAGPGCLDSAPLDLSGFLPGYAERGALRFCRCVGRA